MKTIGLIGGVSWVSSGDYYKLLNEGINRRLGGHNFAKCILYSFNFDEIKTLQEEGDWKEIGRRVTGAARHLAAAGAEAIVICANTIHIVADDLRRDIDVPVIHIAETVATAIRKRGMTRAGLLGTRYTMEMEFFRDKLSAGGVTAIVPGPGDRTFIHGSIYAELARGIFTPATKARYLEIMGKLIADGAEGIILGCTEISLLVSQDDTPIPLFDTVALHVDAAVTFALSP